MDRAVIDKLMQQVDDQHERMRLSVLYNASISTLKAYQQESTTARLRDWQAAEAALAAAAKSPGVVGAASAEQLDRLPRPIDVVRRLKDGGWRCSQSTIYGHIARGLLGEHKDGGFELAAVERYAQAHLKRVGGAAAQTQFTSIDQLQREVQEAELLKRKAQALHWETKALVERDLYIEKSAFNAELAARAALFRSDLENFAASRAGDLIAAVVGDHTRTADLIEILLTEFAAILRRYAAEKAWPRRTRVVFD